MKAFRLLPLAALLLAAPVLAQDAADTVQVGDWSVSPESDSTCQAVETVNDHLLIAFVEDSSGEGIFLMRDEDWKLDDLDDAPGSISWDGWKNAQDLDFTPVQHDDGGWLLIAETGSWFSENLAGSKEFWVKIPGLQYDADFKIPNATDLVTAVAVCNGNH